ncbi:hypothetical protein NW762_005654 [Fusarium torreyae]|uniref:Uncharacterized protein n=1 Tax=Fusarium torreyae TaxID=1237075 RepID=A0A9W8VIT9_9HYPO|nr:hypothetical protein NW762_005654 [Fusarium torreyae]
MPMASRPTPIQMPYLSAPSWRLDQNHTVVQRITLELIYTMGVTLLHRPFLNSMRLENPGCQVALDVCRKIAVRSVGVYVEVDREMQQGGRLHDDQQIVPSLVVGDFLIMTIVSPLEFFDCGNLPPGEGNHIINTLQTAAHLWPARSFASPFTLESSRLIQISLAKIRLASPTLCRISNPVSKSTVAKESELGEEVQPTMQQIDFGGYLEGSSVGEIGPIEWNATPAIDWVC